ncbi:MAG: PQQ-like beta-propeller repeat protein, partial [Candidatus Heimdallarchaeota archaeon]|nr:PQQ-like beta-propeller repeat protein [Candidatus Heimdallarchaeota archaeon]
MRKPIVIILILSIIFSGFAGLFISSDDVEGSSLADSAWPCFQGNVRHTGLSPYDTSLNDGTLKWSYSTEGIVASPTIGPDGTIFVGSDDGKLYAFKSYGRLKWDYEAGSIESAPAIDSNGNIHVETSDNWLHTVLKNGLRTSRISINGVSSPIIDSEGILYIGTNDYSLTSKNIESDFSLIWRFPSPDRVTVSPALSQDGTIYFGTSHYFFA